MYQKQNFVSFKTTDESTESVYHARRAHRKSRAGCLNCKRRRVKCDESRPHCIRCQKHGVDCDYDVVQCRATKNSGIVSHSTKKVPNLTSSGSTVYSMSLAAVAEKIDDLLQMKPRNGQLSDNIVALQHFHNSTLATVGTGGFKGVMRDQSPFLMHTVIAVATTHLCRVVPDNSTYKFAEAYHWQQAISLYSKEISSTVGLHNMDTLFSACLLLTVHSFALEDYNPRASFVFSDNPETLNWLMLQGGLRHLLGLTRPWISQSIWAAPFMESRDENIIFDDHRTGRVGLHPELADICGIDDTTTEETNPYMWPLRMLSPLLLLERSVKSFSKYTTFMGRLLPDYFDKLIQKDPPGLIILSWWLALVSATDLWWANARVRSECTAICMFLEDSDDPLVLKLLEFPAGTCGYLLRHVQERAVLDSCGDLVGVF
ncbi:hypothetical protein MW887_006862 [Aspergillus wentii]|nr:hypothetical protein MW887_006862 [Aspergillus wentii]